MAIKPPFLPADQKEAIDTAAKTLRNGGIVAFPTETVYGLGADAGNEQAVATIYAAKGRPATNPLIVHGADMAVLTPLVEMPDEALALAEAFWPGPLTLVLPLRRGHGLAQAVLAGLPTVALRVPRHPIAHALLDAFGGPVAAPSANVSGQISPTCAEHVRLGLGERVPTILDGGPSEVGLESTIVGFDPEPVILREGGIAREVLHRVLGRPIPEHPHTSMPQTAPGQSLSHYAPRVPMRLNVQHGREDEVMLGFGPVRGQMSLSETGDLEEAAHRLFACLHTLDKLGKTIAVAPVPDHGVGRAINDRLRRAAAPRTRQT